MKLNLRRKLFVLILFAAIPVVLRPQVTSTEPPHIQFCELYTHPRSYAGKLIQLHALVYGKKRPWIDDATYGPPCKAYMTIELVIPKEGSEPHEVLRDSAFRSFEQGIKTPDTRVMADVQGIFEPRLAVQNQAKANFPTGQFVLLKVTDVVLLPVPRK